MLCWQPESNRLSRLWICKGGKLWLFLLLPVAVLVSSFLVAPYFFLASDLAPSIATLPDAPVLLFRYGGCRFFYTSEDLLHPELWGADAPGRYYRAVLFDTYAAGEVASPSPPISAWIVQIGRALLLRSVDGGRIPGREANVADQDLVRDFTRVVLRETGLQRGESLIFAVPGESSFRRLSGVEALVALAIKDPGSDQLIFTQKGASQLAPEAIKLACERLRTERHVTTIGVPFLPLSEKLGDPMAQDKAWAHLIEYLRETASDIRLEKVVFGGFGLNPDNRADTDQAFQRAWVTSRARIEVFEDHLAHEPIRLAGLILLTVLVQALFQKEPVQSRWVVAAAVTAGSLAASISSVADWVRPLLVAPTPLVEFYGKLLFALLTGLFMRQIVDFLGKVKEIVLHG